MKAWQWFLDQSWTVRLVIIVVGVIIVGSIFGNDEETTGQAANDGAAGGPTAPEEPGEPEQSGETFTKDNYAELASNPDGHEGANVDVTGKLLGAAESSGEETAFQMFADPANSEWITIVHYDDPNIDLNPDEYVRVTGSVLGSFEGENAFGGTVTATEVQADSVEVVGLADALDPAVQTWQVGETRTDQGFSITLQKVEFGKATTRAYVNLQNGTGVHASFYAFDSKVIQGSNQIDPTDAYEYTELEPQSDLSPGVQSEGIVTFGPADPNQPLELQFGWSSEDYNITSNPVVFQVTP